MKLSLSLVMEMEGAEWQNALFCLLCRH